MHAEQVAQVARDDAKEKGSPNRHISTSSSLQALGLQTPTSWYMKTPMSSKASVPVSFDTCLRPDNFPALSPVPASAPCIRPLCIFWSLSRVYVHTLPLDINTQSEQIAVLKRKRNLTPTKKQTPTEKPTPTRETCQSKAKEEECNKQTGCTWTPAFMAGMLGGGTCADSTEPEPVSQKTPFL